MVPILDGKFVFPVAVWRRERLLKADHLGVPAEVEEVEPLDDVELDVDEPRPPGEQWRRTWRFRLQLSPRSRPWSSYGALL